jgi:hypothetical protein
MRAGRSCAFDRSHSDGAYAVLRFFLHCPEEIATLDLRYNLLFDLDPQHRGLLRLPHNGETASAIFSPEKAEQKFTVAERSSLRQFLDYCREGVWYIWIGFDHILFLISLLLPAVLVLKAGRWEASFRNAFWEVFDIVTAFTLAHSITLSLAALNVISLPSR